MIVLGLDPGPSCNGWALLDFTIRSSPVWVMGGVEADACDVLQLVEGTPALRPALVGVERANALHTPEANVPAMATAWYGGEAAGYARRAGLPVRALAPHEWRLALVGRTMPGESADAKVKALLSRFVRQLPGRTSVHARDAAGVACVAARVFWADPSGTKEQATSRVGVKPISARGRKNNMQRGGRDHTPPRGTPNARAEVAAFETNNGHLPLQSIGTATDGEG